MSIYIHIIDIYMINIDISIIYVDIYIDTEIESEWVHGYALRYLEPANI
jgi:hypothetical protein